jgi:cytochrome c oxidase cbb3-type subunit III
MSDFTSDFWSLFIVAIAGGGVLACAWLLWSQSRHKSKLTVSGEMETSGHVWDEDLEEYNHPLPKWWMWMFYITVVFAAIYWTLYPGLGTFKGVLGWTSSGQWQKEVAESDAKTAPIFDKFSKMDLKAVAADREANEIGRRLFLTYCIQCHGSAGTGSKGFPNLTDGDWLWGGEPEQIKQSIAEGRNATMPKLGLSADAVKDVAGYVRSLSGQAGDPVRAAKGKEVFATAGCSACHGPEGKGNPAMGAPNLTDKVWLYGGSEATISETVNLGRQNRMPAWKEFLGEAKVHLLTAYVMSLSQGGNKP